MNKYPQHIVIHTKYIWRCGDRYATISMSSYEFDAMDEVDKAKLMEEVELFISAHGEEGHEFVQVKESSDDQVVFVCEKWKMVTNE